MMVVQNVEDKNVGCSMPRRVAATVEQAPSSSSTLSTSMMEWPTKVSIVKGG